MLLVGAGPKENPIFLRGLAQLNSTILATTKKKMESFRISTIQSGMSNDARMAPSLCVLVLRGTFCFGAYCLRGNWVTK